MLRSLNSLHARSRPPRASSRTPWIWSSMKRRAVSASLRESPRLDSTNIDTRLCTTRRAFSGWGSRYVTTYRLFWPALLDLDRADQVVDRARPCRAPSAAPRSRSVRADQLLHVRPAEQRAGDDRDLLLDVRLDRRAPASAASGSSRCRRRRARRPRTCPASSRGRRRRRWRRATRRRGPTSARCHMPRSARPELS